MCVSLIVIKLLDRSERIFNEKWNNKLKEREKVKEEKNFFLFISITRTILVPLI